MVRDKQERQFWYAVARQMANIPDSTQWVSCIGEPTAYGHIFNATRLVALKYGIVDGYSSIYDKESVAEFDKVVTAIKRWQETVENLAEWPIPVPGDSINAEVLEFQNFCIKRAKEAHARYIA